jgi:hypothetical protein
MTDITFREDGTKVLKLAKFEELHLERDNTLYAVNTNANGVPRSVVKLGQPQDVILKLRELIK